MLFPRNYRNFYRHILYAYKFYFSDKKDVRNCQKLWEILLYVTFCMQEKGHASTYSVRKMWIVAFQARLLSNSQRSYSGAPSNFPFYTPLQPALPISHPRLWSIRFPLAPKRSLQLAIRFFNDNNSPKGKRLFSSSFLLLTYTNSLLLYIVRHYYQSTNERHLL